MPTRQKQHSRLTIQPTVQATTTHRKIISTERPFILRRCNVVATRGGSLSNLFKGRVERCDHRFVLTSHSLPSLVLRLHLPQQILELHVLAQRSRHLFFLLRHQNQSFRFHFPQDRLCFLLPLFLQRVSQPLALFLEKDRNFISAYVVKIKSFDEMIRLRT